jgi:RIO kinase 1
LHSETVSDAVDSLIADQLIDDVLFPVKSGKEATIFCCSGGVRAPAEFVAVKVYKEQRFRAFRNDSMYQEGRVILDRRARRAVSKRTQFGREVQASGWTNAEYETLRVLHRAGSSVPEPYGHSAGAIAMEWIGDADHPALQLKEVRHFVGGRGEAQALLDRLLAEIELWLACNVVHGDLSAYNLLWSPSPSRLIAIDFPQACDPRFNPNAAWLLSRDVRNVCGAFARFGAGTEAEPDAIVNDLWERFTRGQL